MNRTHVSLLVSAFVSCTTFLGESCSVISFSIQELCTQTPCRAHPHPAPLGILSKHILTWGCSFAIGWVRGRTRGFCRRAR